MAIFKAGQLVKNRVSQEECAELQRVPGSSETGQLLRQGPLSHRSRADLQRRFSEAGPGPSQQTVEAAVWVFGPLQPQGFLFTKVIRIQGVILSRKGKMWDQKSYQDPNISRGLTSNGVDILVESRGLQFHHVDEVDMALTARIEGRELCKNRHIVGSSLHYPLLHIKLMGVFWRGY